MPVDITPGSASTYAITVAEAKTHLRVTTSDDDTYIEGLIAAASEYVQSITGRQLLTATVVYRRDYFPGVTEIPLPKPPLVSVTTLQYVDENGTTQTWSVSNYSVDTTTTPGRILLGYGLSWPTARSIQNAVIITYMAGYGDASDVPEQWKHLLKLLVTHWYELRSPVMVGGSISEIPKTVDALLEPLRVWTSEP